MRVRGICVVEIAAAAYFVDSPVDIRVDIGFIGVFDGKYERAIALALDGDRFDDAAGAVVVVGPGRVEGCADYSVRVALDQAKNAVV